MANRGGRPPESGKDRNWSALKFPLGARYGGWVAGDTIWYTCHTAERSAYCPRVYEGSDVQCDLCRLKRPLGGMGFIPMYDERDDTRVVARVRSDMYALCDTLALHECISVVRVGKVSMGAQVAKRKNADAYSTKIASRRQRADISTWLVGYLKLDGLVTADQMLAGPVWQPDYAEWTACVEPIRAEETPPVDELATGAACVAEKLGLTPPGSAAASVAERNERWVRDQTAKGPKSNGKH